MKHINLFCRMCLISFGILTFAVNASAEALSQSNLPDGAKARLGKGRIFDVAYSPDGKRLAVASSIGVWLYDAETGVELNLLTGHAYYAWVENYAQPYVRNVSFSPDGQTLLSRYIDGSAIVWDAVTGELLLDRLGGGDVISLSPDGSILASGGSGAGWGSIRFYDVTTGEHLRTIDDKRTAERNKQLELRIGSSVSYSVISSIYGSVRSLSFRPDGKTLASGLSDGTIRIWDAQTDELLRTVVGHASGVENIAYHPDGKTLASSGRLDGVLRIWDADTGELLHTLTGHTGWIHSLSFSPDGKTLASASQDETIRIWDANTGEHLHTLTEHTAVVYSVSFHPNGKTIASVSEDATLRIWDATTGTYLRTLTRHTGWVESVSFSPDGKTLASGNRDETVRIYDAQTSELLHTLTGHTGYVSSVAFRPDGQVLASGSADHSIRFWDATTGKHLRTLTGHLGPVSSVAFGPDGRTLASGSADGSIRIWDVVSGETLYILVERATEVTCVAFRPDGRTLASGSLDGWIRIWDAAIGEHLRTLPDIMRKVSIAFSPDGQALASGGWWSEYIRVWDTTTDALLLIPDPSGQAINSMAFSPDGRMLAIGNVYRTYVWDIDTGEPLHELGNIEHGSQVHSVSFSPDGRTLASGIENGTVLLWEITPLPVAEERIPEDVNADGTVNIQDLVLVAANLGDTGQNTADVNGDGTVNVLDLTRVAGALGTAAGAPSDWKRNLTFTPTREQVFEWLEQARQMNITDPAFQRGILILERLLASLTPKETVLLPNYPNPFNPETWIPYQLSESVAADITIYSADGQLVRRLSFGYQPAGRYESRSRAAYWDGRNETGELVASGLYFYTLTAGEFSETRKMLIRK